MEIDRVRKEIKRREKLRGKYRERENRNERELGRRKMEESEEICVCERDD